jgi:hypothetical protein
MTRTRILALAIALATPLAWAQDATPPAGEAAQASKALPGDAAPADPAPAAMTMPQVRAALEAQGYTGVNDIEFEDGMWKADARSADGQRVDLRMDAAGRHVWPDDGVSNLSEADVRARLSAAGYTAVGDVEFDDGMWEARAEDAQGRRMKLVIDPAEGRVVGESRD